MASMSKEPSTWFVYMLRCVDDTLYTGITTDLERRVVEHNSSALGAKYTRGRRPVKLVYQEKSASRALALKRECQLKGLSRRKKEILIE